MAAQTCILRTFHAGRIEGMPSNDEMADLADFQAEERTLGL